MGAFPFVAPPVGLSAQSAACLPSGLRRQPLLSLPGPGKRCTASFSPRGFESNLIGYNQTAAPPLWVALLFGSPCWTLRSIRGLLALRAAQATAPFAPRPRKTMHRIVFASGLRVQPHRVQPNSSATPLGGAAVWLPLLDSNQRHSSVRNRRAASARTPSWRSLLTGLPPRSSPHRGRSAPPSEQPRSGCRTVPLGPEANNRSHKQAGHPIGCPACLWLPLLDSNQRHCG